MTGLLTAPSAPPLPPPTGPAVGVAQPQSGWAIFWRGRVFSEADLTGQHLATLALLTGTDDYEALDIDPRNGHQRLMQMIAAFLCVDDTSGLSDPATAGDAISKAISEVSKASADEILGALRLW